jgi:hypothetical protein
MPATLLTRTVLNGKKIWILVTEIHDLKEPEQLAVSELFYRVAEREFCFV